ncbi:MAG: hypothetical protein US54_C0053G0006 [Candidatus Roizmanbacteria bacterium GW2011_GWA2_37_7]|uniref:Uncharacterized protein n=1 Tax=Candidatus Roizmanbacteria bacterium GW2011_GWA2_37_7 TaxID=1618481 RepID=A0A0G0HE71_9BACT|nr:MAG: hypothetical protein US54_C0053G0006 [Candidatus Roizmanbacteria bacterium GW2011_GWA2_37_7]
MSEQLSRRSFLRHAVLDSAALGVSAAFSQLIPTTPARAAGLSSQVESPHPSELIGQDQFAGLLHSLVRPSVGLEQADTLARNIIFQGFETYPLDWQDHLFRSMLKTTEFTTRASNGADIFRVYDKPLTIAAEDPKTKGDIGGSYLPDPNKIGLSFTSKEVLAILGPNEITSALIDHRKASVLVPNFLQMIVAEAQSDVMTSVALHNAQRGDQRFTFQPAKEIIEYWDGMIINHGYNSYVPTSNIPAIVFHGRPYNGHDQNMNYFKEHMAKVVTDRIFSKWVASQNRTLSDVLGVFADSKTDNHLYQALSDLAQFPDQKTQDPLQDGDAATIMTFNPYDHVAAYWPSFQLLSFHKDGKTVVPYTDFPLGRDWKVSILRNGKPLYDPAGFGATLYQGNIWRECGIMVATKDEIDGKPPRLQNGDIIQVEGTHNITKKYEVYPIPVYLKPDLVLGKTQDAERFNSVEQPKPLQLNLLKDPETVILTPDGAIHTVNTEKRYPNYTVEFRLPPGIQDPAGQDWVRMCVSPDGAIYSSDGVLCGSTDSDGVPVKLQAGSVYFYKPTDYQNNNGFSFTLK